MSAVGLETPSTRPARAVPAILRDAALAALFTLFTLLLFELGIRLAGEPFHASFFSGDAVRRYSFRPSAEGWWMIEGRHYLRMNRLGYHDFDHTPAKPPNVTRIAVVGSSFVAACHVPIEQGFVSLLAHDLNDRPTAHRRIETLDFGVDAYSPPQFLETLDKDVWQFHPDIVTFPVSYMDLINSSREIAFAKNTTSDPFYDVDASGQVIPDAGTQRLPSLNSAQIAADSRANNRINESQLASAWRAAHENLPLQLHLVSELSAAKPGQDPVTSQPLYPQRLALAQPPHNGPMEKSWRILAALLPQVQRDAVAHGAKLFVLAVGGMAEQDGPDPAAREAFRKQMNASDLYYPDRRVCEIATANHLDCLRLPPRLAEYATQHHAYLHGFPSEPLGTGHWNPLGHQVVARFIASHLSQTPDLQPLLR